MLRKIITVAENQRALVFKNQVLSDVLLPGEHKYWKFGNQFEFQSCNVDSLYFSQPNAERLYEASEVLRSQLTHLKTDNHEVGILRLNGYMMGVIAPGQSLYVWKAAGNISLEKRDISDSFEVDKQTLYQVEQSGTNTADALIRGAGVLGIAPIKKVQVANEHVGLLFVDGALASTLEPGVYGFWQFARKIEVKIFDCRTQLIDVSGQEILSKDRVSLRINLTAGIKIENAELASASVDNVGDYIYKTLQLALREAVGTKTLDDLLLDKLYINETVTDLVAEPLNSIGVKLVNVGMKDIILPGEMKAILNQVVEAQKAAEANVIKRREETAATRSLHNTAKVMENNPTLMRLKELEALEKVADKIETLTVYGGLDGLMNGVVKIA
ncbi:slipin family protein [Vibrio nigripulchritudo]|uniref:slipin family protein n=1 Tax=Vibrio nigripulchritudo TaxID=28173 RepID=UPI002490D073|nr:slipin family protein [Vibrio nigripulchritudo]BDU37068.1 hypothetical protein TUMSATVNIG2_15370 [Vibrio nigripulchritudo]BDU42781.1 hypothetical protein TUMSATVNIG3_15790 [Vibrio nigripulchritudo]